jgi:hypothetical protein
VGGWAAPQTVQKLLPATRGVPQFVQKLIVHTPGWTHLYLDVVPGGECSRMRITEYPTSPQMWGHPMICGGRSATIPYLCSNGEVTALYPVGI